jgi:hypothetical protein
MGNHPELMIHDPMNKTFPHNSIVVFPMAPNTRGALSPFWNDPLFQGMVDIGLALTLQQLDTYVLYERMR